VYIHTGKFGKRFLSFSSESLIILFLSMLNCYVVCIPVFVLSVIVKVDAMFPIIDFTILRRIDPLLSGDSVNSSFWVTAR
jgi:hypothetical protein